VEKKNSLLLFLGFSQIYFSFVQNKQNMMQAFVHIWQYFLHCPSLYLTIYLLFPQWLLNNSLSLIAGLSHGISSFDSNQIFNTG